MTEFPVSGRVRVVISSRTMYVWVFLGVGSVCSFDNALKLIGTCQHDFVNNRKNVKRIK